MVIIPDQCIFVFTPKTGSRALERALLDHVPGAYLHNDKVHHADPATIPNNGLPVHAVLRSPYRQALSWFWPWRDRHETIRDFLRDAPPGRPWMRKRLNVYDGFVDKYHLYEMGLTRILWNLGAGDVEIPKIGVSGVDLKYLTADAMDAVDEYFPEDVKLYESSITF